MSDWNRRQWLRATGAAMATAFVAARSARAVVTAVGRETKTISYEPAFYHGWPTLARSRSGRLLLAYSGGRESHVCPFGRLEWMQSDDGGQSWTWPRVLLDTAIDDRDAGVVETATGALLVTTFTSLAYESLLAKAEQNSALPEKNPWPLPPERLEAWRAAHRRLTPEQRKTELGVWMLRSTDSGVTWSAPYRCLVNSPHGPVQLTDGRLLYAGKALWEISPEQVAGRTGVCESTDDGLTWRWLADLPVRPGDDSQQYHELHAVETADGQLILHIRNHNPTNAAETLQSESSDGGKTWSVPHPIGVWGLPSHLLRLRNGHLLMSYGHRRPPFGNQARVSGDHGRTWSEPLIISDDGAGQDLGYPSTVELDDGSLVTVWYEALAGSPRAVLRQATWVLQGI
ncbi:MAG: sialidase family protein [Pirellulaceae bacterium]